MVRTQVKVKSKGAGAGGKDASQSQVKEFISEAESLCLKNTTSGEKGVKKHTNSAIDAEYKRQNIK